MDLVDFEMAEGVADVVYLFVDYGVGIILLNEYAGKHEISAAGLVLLVLA